MNFKHNGLISLLAFSIVTSVIYSGCGRSPESSDEKFPGKEQPKAMAKSDAPFDVPDEAATKEQTVSFLSWNVESEGADPEIIGKQLSELGQFDVFALQEVDPADFDLFQSSMGNDFDSIRSNSGNKDRLQIMFNKNRFELVRKMELDEINHLGRYRSPLVAHLKDKTTGLEFLVMTNHLVRGKAEIRQEQAGQLVEWARDQTLPVVAIGDFNFDYVFATETGNDAFKIFQRDGIWNWVKPVEMIDSNWFDPEGDGVDNYEGSLLDFAFVAGPASKWSMESKVVVRDGDFPDDEKTSDHRPLTLKVFTK